MSLTLSNPAPPQKQPAALPENSARKRSPRRRRIRIVLMIITALLLVDFGISIALESGWLRRSLTNRLEAAFGRPIEVSNYSFSLLEGPRIEANYITVGEDPRFGHEYFLRADQVAAGIRWSALFRGKLELGALSISNPSLNLVRLPDGEWNLESWLPRPPGNPRLALASYRASARPQLIEVSNGRINFKEGDTKLPFAFISVDGSVEETSPGRWRIDLEAQPFRAAVDLEQAGELTLRGLVGGTSSRLRPASLELNWDAASISDVLRLFRGFDYGMRGLLSLQLKAQTHGYDWDFSSAAQFRRLHRWDLPMRDDDPAANLDVQATWHPATARLALTQAVIELPRSNIHATGAMTFEPAADPANPQQASIKDERMEIASKSVVLSDVLAWYRAFHQGVAEQFEVHGSAALNFTFAGWPPQIQKGEITTEGAEADGGRIPVIVRMEKALLLFSPNAITLPPAIFSAGTRNGEFRLRALMQRAPDWRSSWKLDGHTQDVRSLFDAAESLGFSLPAGWQLDGPAGCNLAWAGGFFPAFRNTSGTITLNGLQVGAPFLNHAITHVKASISLSPQLAKIQLGSANAFATDWHGSLQRSAIDGQWKFALSASELSAVAMDRWLNPQRREDLLDRILPFLASTPQPQHMPAWLRARGTLSIGQFTLSPFQFHELRAGAAIDGREWKLSNAAADFYGGALSGEMSLDLAAQPAYNVAAEFRGVHLGQLAARTFSLTNLFSGTVSGAVRVSAKGLGRGALLHSLSCKGQAQMRNASYAGMDLMESVAASARRPGITIFPQASADFSCANGRLNFSPLQLQSPRGNFRATGYVDFQRHVSIELLPVSDDPLPALSNSKIMPPASFGASYELTGMLNSPQIARIKTHVLAH
ncbi:MAG TPA: AsmA family protein [Candidatus Acidoferrales bacterium]|nr:AsmA family protein [Candidatus Acidoferrales bacterium]